MESYVCTRFKSTATRQGKQTHMALYKLGGGGGLAVSRTREIKIRTKYYFRLMQTVHH
jgi:hypothetical protein